MRSSESDRDTFLSVKRKENKDKNKDPETQITKNEKSLVECLAQVIGTTKKFRNPKSMKYIQQESGMSFWLNLKNIA